MIYLSESVRKILERIEKAYKRRLKEGTMCYSLIRRNGKAYEGREAIRILLDEFIQFKEELEYGKSKLLYCDEGKEEFAKIQLMDKIWEYCEPLTSTDINMIQNDVIVQRGLKIRIQNLAKQTKTKEEAMQLLYFINTAHSSSWGQLDANYKVREFRLVKSEKEFEKILLKYSEAKELTDNEENDPKCTTIRVALVPISWRVICCNKGIWEDYRTYVNKISAAYLDTQVSITDAFNMFMDWHGVKDTAIYYVYVPKVNE